jgi:hypothetical protein
LKEILETTKVDDAFTNNMPQMEQISSILQFMQTLLDNSFDKSILSLQKLPEKYGMFTRSFLEYFSKNLCVAQ